MGMAIYVETKYLGELINLIEQKTCNHEVISWIVDNDGDYTINSEQWRYHAWFRIIPQKDTLTFGIIQSKRYPMTNMLYGVYHGQMVETLLIYFSDLIENIKVTPDPIENIDMIKVL